MKPKCQELDIKEAKKMWRSGELMMRDEYPESSDVHVPFTPSPTKVVKFVNGKGEVVEERQMNRADRRRLKIR